MSSQWDIICFRLIYSLIFLIKNISSSANIPLTSHGYCDIFFVKSKIKFLKVLDFYRQILPSIAIKKIICLQWLGLKAVQLGIIY